VRSSPGIGLLPAKPGRFVFEAMLIQHSHWQEYAPDPSPGAAPRSTSPARLGGTRARVSVDTEAQTFGSLLTAAVNAPLTSDETWSAFDLDARTLARMSPTRLLELLADLSPEVSKALWDFLRMCNPGYVPTAMRPSGKLPGQATHQQALDDFLGVLKTRYGSVDVVIGRLFISAFLRGALMAELVLDDAGRAPLDIATPDPASARWRQVQDPQLGPVWQLGQWQGGAFVPLDRDTIRYVPVDPLPGRPQGRAIAAPSLFAAVFLLAMLHDIRRVVQQQGYPRLDLSVDLEKLAAAMPRDAANDPETFKVWVNAIIREVETVYASLEPDDAYIHTSVVNVNRPVGTVDSSSLGAVDQLIAVLERMLVRALKTIPLLFGMTDGVSEANANRQWEMHVAGIKAIQHLCEGLLEHLLTLALRAQGIPAVVQWRFAELRAAEMLRDAQTESQQISNESAKYQAGWTSQDEASNAVTGHDADEPEPRGVGAIGQVAANPDPGGLK
jgi:hypothetical protein